MLYGAAGLLALTLAGCGGGGGGTAASTTGSGTGGTSAAVTTIPTAAALTANDTATNPNAAFTAVLNAGVAPVTVNSPPKINFTVFSGGAVVKGLTASNVSVIMAKLVPGANGAADQWVSYTYRKETATSTVGPSGAPVMASAMQATTDSKQTDATLLAQQLAYNDAGYYTYTFKTDIKDTAQTNGVTFEPNLTHRVALQLSYTSSTGSTVSVNPYFDFTIDANGNAVAVTDAAKTRKVVDVSSCNECHQKLALHGGGRLDTQYCAMCHNPGTTDSNSGNVVDFGPMVHKIHAGEHLKDWFGTSYTIWGYRDSKHDYGEVTYPQPLKNCQKCHSGDKKDSAGKQLAAQGDNWKSRPTRTACGACHAGINFATGKGLTIADAEAGLTTSTYGHVGGIQADDKNCALCHSAAAIPVYHTTVDHTGANGRGGYPLNTATNTPTAGYPAGQGPSIPLASQLNLPSGVYKINFEIKQATVDTTTSKATVVYRVLKDGSPVTFNATGNLIDNVDGSPGVYVLYATTQDGITAPADWNGSKSASMKTLRDTAGAQTGPDASGYYTATIPTAIPADAKLVTAAVGVDYNGFVQLNHADYPKGIRLREPQFVMKVADGYAGRRSIVDNAKCNNCHGQLGVSPSFHSGARNNGEGCATGGCHDANKNTGHTGASNNYGGGWSVASKNMIHAIHAASKREQKFTYEATAAKPDGFGNVTYPGVLKNCETCHVSGGYDFSSTAAKAAADNFTLLWTTDAKTDMTNAGNVASIGLSPWISTSRNGGQADYRTDHLVSSPIASACFGCHDSSLAVQHMESNGGTLVRKLSTVSNVGTTAAPRPAVGATSTMAFSKTEQCMLCHASGKVADIKAMHAK